MVSLCERCQNYNWRKMQTIIDVFRDAGMERPRHIWCSATNRPEEIEEWHCSNFKPYQTASERREKSPKPRYKNRPMKLSGHRRIKASQPLRGL